MSEAVTAVTARYDRAEQAGRAVERLSAGGVEAGRIHVLTPEGGSTRRSQRGTDAGTSRRLGRRFLQGVLVGAVVGAVFGAVVVVIVTGAGSGAWLAGALGGAAAGAGLGALTGLQSAPTMARAWEGTFAPEHDGPVTIAVEIRDDRAGTRHSPADVEESLRATGPREIRRVHDLEAAARELRGQE